MPVWLTALVTLGGILKEAMHVAGLVIQARLEKDEELRKTKGDMLDAAKKAIDSGDVDHIIDLADKLRQPGC